MDSSTEILYDHYKDTCAGIGDAIRRRERLMIWLIGVLGLFAFQTAFPIETSAALSGFFLFKFGIPLSFNLSVIGTVVWFLLVMFTVRYYQTVALIEERYTYVHKLEGYLAKVLDGPFVSREGQAYRDAASWFKGWTWILYTIVFPLILVLVASSEIFHDWSAIEVVCPPSIYLLLNSVAFVIVMVSTLCYLHMVHGVQNNNNA